MPDANVRDVTPALARRYMYHLDGLGLRPSSWSNLALPLHVLYRMHVHHAAVESHPLLDIRIPKKDAAGRLLATDDEQVPLLHAPTRQPGPVRAARDHAILSLPGLRACSRWTWMGAQAIMVSRPAAGIVGNCNRWTASGWGTGDRNTMNHPAWTRLEQRLQQLNAELFGAYQRSLQVALDLMPRAYATFWNYTDHSLTHLRKVVEIIDQLCTDSLVEQLTADEIFVLLAGAILHDIGMVTLEPLAGEDADAARRGHDVVGAEKVRQHPQRYGVPPRYADAVATLVRHHRSSDIVGTVQDQAAGTRMVRLQLLCALVRAGDELHLTQDRAPEVVIESLELSDESAKHFANCQAVTGVALRCPGEPSVVVQARVDDSLAEQGIGKIIGKVNDELTRLAPIFTKFGLPVYRAEPALNREGLVKKRVLLHLCSNLEGRTVAAISSELGEAEHEVEDAFRGLAAERLIRKVEGEAQVYAIIPRELSVFRDVATKFIGTAEDLAFLRSPYAGRAIEQLVMPELCRKYSCAYQPTEEKVRTSVLQRSPSALRLAFLATHAGHKESLISRRVLLDQLLLSGALSDVYARPEIAEGTDLAVAAGQLGRHVAQRAGPFARLISRAWTYREVPANEMLQRICGEASEEIPNELEPIRGSLQVEHPAEPAFLSLPHLMVAAYDERVPLEIASPQLKSFEVRRGDRSLVAVQGDAAESVHLRIDWNPPRPALPWPQVPCRLEVDEAQGSCRIIVKPDAGFEDEEFPFRMEVEADASGCPNKMSPRLDHCGPMPCGAWLQRLKLERLLADRGRCTVEVLTAGGEPTRTEWDAKTGEVPEGRDNYIRAIEILARAERVIGSSVTAHLMPTDAQVAEILKREHELTASSEEATAALHDIAERHRVPMTRVRVTALDHTGHKGLDFYPAAFPHLTALLTTSSGAGHDQAATEQLRREGGEIQYWTSLSPHEVVEEYLKNAAAGNFWPGGLESACQGTAQSEVRLVIQPVSDALWGPEQVAHLTVREQPAHRRLVDVAGEATKQGDFERAEELLVECILTEPTLATAHFNLGLACYNLRQLKKADRSFSNALTLNTDGVRELTARAHSMIGLIRLHQGNIQGSREHYQHALEINPAFDIGEAVAMIEARLPTNINASAAHYVAGWLRKRQGKPREATAHLKWFLEIADPFHASLQASAREVMSSCTGSRAQRRQPARRRRANRHSRSVTRRANKK
jgi:tetratricopeptide (TPR) repeat protein/HD superfamily phosphodiesterase